MLSRPCLRAGWRYEIIDRSCLALRSETGVRWLHGRAYPLLVPLLDGQRSALEIGEVLQAHLSAEETHYALALLERKGFIGEPCPDLPPAQPLFEAVVEIAGCEGSIYSELRDALESRGLRVGAAGSHQLMVAPDYLADGLDQWNRRAIESGRPWMLLNPFARVACIGPLLRPGVSACWKCLAHRLRENRRTLPWPAAGAPSASALSVALRLAAGELAKWIALEGATPLDGSLLTFDHATCACAWHNVHRLPGCEACGQPEAAPAEPRPVRPAAQTRHPDETLARLEKQVSPITGIVSSLEEMPGFVWRARLNCRDLFAWGKGLNSAQSRVRCLAEAVERYSICIHGSEPRVRSALSEIGSAAVHPRDLFLFSDAQYEGREEWNNHAGRRLWIPEPYDGSPIDWAPAWSLTCDRARWVPASFCYLDHASEHDNRFLWSDSNGCAAGSTVEEAILQGLLELVERDAVALWWYNRVQRPAIHAAELAPAANLRLLDLTTDLGIPVVAALSVDTDRRSLYAGFGADPDAAVAIRRAIAELKQQEAAGPPDCYDDAGDQPQLVPLPGEMRSYPAQSWSDVVDRARRCGLEVIVVDMTRAEIGFPVVRVIVPGLRHHKPRLAPGRLYDTPVQLGWLDRPRLESEMNPMFPPL